MAEKKGEPTCAMQPTIGSCRIVGCASPLLCRAGNSTVIICCCCCCCCYLVSWLVQCCSSTGKCAIHRGTKNVLTCVFTHCWLLTADCRLPGLRQQLSTATTFCILTYWVHAFVYPRLCACVWCSLQQFLFLSLIFKIAPVPFLLKKCQVL